MESAALATDDDDREFLTGRQIASNSWRQGALKSALAVGLGVACFAAGRRSLTAPSVTEVEQKYDIGVIPPMERCAKDGQTCISSMCCMTAGHVCYEKDSKSATCKKEGSCTEGTCKVLKPAWAMQPALYKPGASLFCWSAYIVDMGPKETLPPNHQLELLQKQAQVGSSIFACNSWKVYGDTAAMIGGKPVGVVSNPGDWHNFMRQDKPKLWANAMIYFSIWKAIAADGLWQSAPWTVKVDPWSVFIPQRLVNFMATQDVTQTGVYYDTCKEVMEGYFGNLEVASQQAMKAFLEQLDHCKATLKYNGAGWKWGPWGEDLFQQHCFDTAGVNKVAGYGLSNSGTCVNNRPEAQKQNASYIPTTCVGQTVAVMHPFKTPEAYFKCLSEMQR